MILLCGCDSSITASDQGVDQNQLSPCTTIGTPFETLAFSDWPETYDSTVSKVIEAHLDMLQNVSTQPLECTAADYAGVSKPTTELTELAKTLFPWKDPKKLQKLSESDIAPVLLEYVREYECSLSERKNFVAVIIPQENINSAGGNTSVQMNRQVYEDTKDDQTRIINEEMAVSRPALNEALMLIGGKDRLQPLTLDIECLKRISLDIRNIMGLVSQASACLPRARDARGSLRDLPPQP